MRLRHIASLTLLAVSVVSALAADAIGPGTPAPKLEIKRWVKGTPVKNLDPKKTYVVEFWATWCGPCIQSIPHLTEIAKKNKDVTFIGVGIWEEDQGDTINKFVENMGDKMSYNVAYSGNKDGMATSWMEAAGQNGIPTAFIVKGGKIQWVGHPMELEKPLSEVKAGTFDLEGFKKVFEKQAAANRAQMAANAEYSAALKLRQQGKKEEASKALDAVVKKYPDFASSAERTRYDWLADDDPAAWDAKTKTLLDGGKSEDLQMVASFALARAQKPEGAAKARSTIGMVLKANTKDDFLVYWYVRSVYVKLNDNKEALDVTNKLIELLPSSQYKDNAQLKDSLVKGKAELEAKLKGS